MKINTRASNKTTGFDYQHAVNVSADSSQWWFFGTTLVEQCIVKRDERK